MRCGRNNMYNKQFCDFAYASHYRCRLCTWINKRGVWNKRGGWQNSPKLINGECWISLGRVAKNAIINKRGVPSIRNSRVDTENYRPVSVNLLYPKYSNVAFVIKSIQTLTIHWLGIKYAIERDTASTFIDCNVWKL